MSLENVKIFNADPFIDNRGELWTMWNSKDFTPSLNFNHDKVSFSTGNVLRGIHGDNKSWKLITCLHGEIFLVVVDPISLEHLSIVLSQENKISVLVPPGIGNGHLVMSESAIFFYKWSYEGEYPDVNGQFTLRWDDPKLGIKWPTGSPILSQRDANARNI